MCLAVPSKIVSIDSISMAEVDVMGIRRTCSLRLVPQAKVGDYVLVHAGFAIQLIEEQEAAETLALFKELPDLFEDEIPEEAALEDSVQRTA